MKRVAFTNLRSLNRCYSTISIQPTVSHIKHIQNTPIDSKSSTSSVNIKSHNPIPESKDIKQQIVNLQKVPKLFKDESGLFHKIDLLVQKLKYPNTPIKIGVLGSKKTFLNTLLADPFASDQSWYDSLLERKNPSSFKYNGVTDIQGSNYNIPSPILEAHNIEFLELNELNYKDGCHLYLNFGDPIEPRWPTYEFQDDLNEVPSSNELNSEIAFEAVNLLKESPLNSTIYTNLYNSSNFPHFNESLAKIINPEIVIAKLYKSIVKQLQLQNISNSLTLKDLELKDFKIKQYIAQWDESAHREFQTQFQPFVTQYESKNLAWWKLYYKNDDIEGILTHMLNTGFLNNSLKNFSYVKGQIDSFSSFRKDQLSDISTELDQNALTQLKDQIITNELYPLQQTIIKQILINFVGLQLPVVLISAGGAFFYDFSLYSMGGLGSLGVVLGLNNVSKKWLSLITGFKASLFEKTRLAIMETNQQLYKHWDVKYNVERAQILERSDLIKTLEQTTRS